MKKVVRVVGLKPTLLREADYHAGMNDVKISLAQGQENFAKFLIANTKISVLYKDSLGRHALDLAITSLCCSDDTLLVVNQKWYEQCIAEYVQKKVSQLPQKPRDK